MYVYYNTVATRNAECCSNEEGEKKDKGAKTEALRLFQEEKKKKDRDVLWVNRRNELRRKETSKTSFLNTLKFAAEQLERSKSEKEKDKESMLCAGFLEVTTWAVLPLHDLCVSVCVWKYLPPWRFSPLSSSFLPAELKNSWKSDRSAKNPKEQRRRKKKEERKKKKLSKGKKEREKERERHRGLFRCYPVLSCLVLSCSPMFLVYGEKEKERTRTGAC